MKLSFKPILKYSMLIISLISFAGKPGYGQTPKLKVWSKRKIQQEISFAYKPLINFSRIEKTSGSYHPIKFVNKFSHAFEFSYGIKYKHFVVDLIYKRINLVERLQMTDDIDSSATGKGSHGIYLMEDTMKFNSFGIRLGRNGRINKRLDYSVMLGLKNDITSADINHGRFFFTYAYTDSITNIKHYTGRASAYSRTPIPIHNIGEFDLTLKLKYYLLKYIFINASITYYDNPFRLFSETNYFYIVDYDFYSIKNFRESIGSGIGHTRFNQLHAGLGLSVVF